MRIGFLLASGPERPDGATVGRLARAALDRGHSVQIFLMKEGVEHVRKRADDPSAEEITALIAAGAEVTLCALNARLRFLAKEDAVPGVVFGSQYDHARIVAASDRYLAFG